LSLVVRRLASLTLLVSCAVALPRQATAQAVADTTRSGVGVRLAFPDGIVGLRLPGAAVMPPRGPLGAAAVVERFRAGLDDQLAVAALGRQRQRLLARLYRGDSLALALQLDPSLGPRPPRDVFGLASSNVELNLDGQLELEISTDRFKNLRCTAFQLQDPLSGCQPKFTAPRIDNRLDIQVDGVIGQRVFVDVNLDTQRDYTNANTIRAYYQGLQDEVLQRVDVGTVQFRPPPSRFLTAGIPINNFGVSAVVEYGPFTVQGLMATQKGSVVAERTYRVGDETVEPQDRLARDLDYEAGRFFWVVDPTTLPGYPAIDALTLDALPVPATVRPTEVRVYRYRAATGNVGANPNLGGIAALARNANGTITQQVGPLRWELLVAGEHYWLDPSGLWVVLSARLDPDDYLAVSYVTESGTRVGTFPATDNPAVTDSLFLVVEPNRGPQAGTFRHALRNIYRVAGADLNRSSLEVAVLLNRSERPENEVSTWLSRFGLAVPTDQAIFDIDNRLFPRVRDPGASLVIRDNFIVFPNLEPFGDPNLVTDPVARNDSLYRTPEYLLLTEGPPAKFQLHLAYLASGGGDRSSVSLNALQIREGTEQIFVDGRRLTQGIDYSIAYETGAVTFLDPDALFGTRAATVTARFEQRGFFAVAPTSIMGLTARYRLGDVGGINLVGLYQSEATAFNRPPLGFEPTASLIGGVSTDLRFDLPGVNRFFTGLIKGPQLSRTTLELDAELAFSRPDPNRSGEAYLEEFENDQAIPIVLRENAWQFGSRPESPLGAEPYGFAAGFDSLDAVQLIWQNLVPDGRGGIRELRPTDIDTNIVIRGGNAVSSETVMYLTFHADTAGGIVAFNNHAAWTQPRRDGAPRWRSMVTPISTTGRDLSRNEFLEFWVFESADRPITSNGMRMLVDLGTVSEDALGLAPETFTVTGGDTTWTGRQYPGAGELDTERSATGIFNAATDDLGILGDRPLVLTPGQLEERVQTCRRNLSNLVEVFPWGDLGARCTVGNGVLDTEDLDGDLLLNARGENEDVFRYVVDLDDPKFRVRTGVQTVDPNDSTRVAGWTLYRVPLREVDRTIGAPNIRLVKHLRFTFLTPPDNGLPDPIIRFAMARMRLVGAPWLARADAPIQGIAGSTAQPVGEVTVTSISTENVELDYESPPGLGNTINEVGSGAEGLGVQVNEKSLRTIAHDLRSGSRAEAYHRFSGGTQNLLAYRELRVWVRGRGEGWDDQRLRAFVKVGTDDDNFYYFEGAASTVHWQPELVVSLDRWRELRAEIETRFLRGEAPSGAVECGGDPTAWVACDAGYVVHVKDPGIKPPNLAAVQEVATGIRYADPNGLPIAETELWTDDIRLSAPITEVGVAMAASGRLVAGDLAVAALSYVMQDGNFRQVGQAPSYRDTRSLLGNTTLQLGRFFSPDLGLLIPVSISHSQISVDPELITGTDVRGSSLVGLRRPESQLTAVQMSAARIRTDGSFLVRTLVNPLRVSGNWTNSNAITEYNDADSRTWGLVVAWDKQFMPAGPGLGLGGLVGRLPGWLARSDAARGIANARFNLVPSQLRVQSDLSRTVGHVTSFTVPIERLEDTLLIPTENLQHLWRNSSSVSWRPLGMLTLGGNWQSTRDLRLYSDSTVLGRLAGQSRRTVFGLDVGTERDRNVTTSLTVAPAIASWFRPRFSSGSNFTLSRSLTARNPVRVDGDTAGAFILPQTLNNARTNEVGFSLEPATLARRLFGDSSWATAGLARMRPVDASWSRTYTSTYDLAAFDPGGSYQLGIGGFDSFLSQEGIPAVGAAEIHTGRVSGNIDLPVGLSADIRYGSTTADRYQRSAGDRFAVTRTVQLDWPDASLNWSRSFRGGPLTLVTLSGSIRQREASTTSPAADSTAPPGLTSTESTNYRPGMRLFFRNRISIAANATIDRSESINNGNLTERKSDGWDTTIEWSVRLPFGARQNRKPLRTSLFARGFTQQECLVQAGSELCAPIADIRRTEMSARMDTDIVGEGIVTGALSVQYVLNDYRHLDRKTSTLSLSLALRMPLSTFGGL
jgi:hypothetical protein